MSSKNRVKIVKHPDGRVNVKATARANGMARSTLLNRLYVGASLEKALTKPLEKTGVTMVSKGKPSSEYYSWHAAKRRATDPKNHAWSDYGGRGIRMCSRWTSSFEAFLTDMGPKPSLSHSIDRKNNDSHYSCGDHNKCWECWIEGWPANCRWATKKEQSSNMRTNTHVETPWGRHTLKEACRLAGLNYMTVRDRIQRNGISAEGAIFHWKTSRIYVETPEGRIKLKEACRRVGLNYETVLSRIKRKGMTPEEAISFSPLR